MTFKPAYIREQRFYQRNHPELKPGETFYSNVNRGEELNKIDTSIFRIGSIAYNSKGSRLVSCAPVFHRVSK